MMDRSKIFKVVSTTSLTKSQARTKVTSLMGELLSYAGAELVRELELILAEHKEQDTSLVELIGYYERADESHRKQLVSMAKLSVESMIYDR